MFKLKDRVIVTNKEEACYGLVGHICKIDTPVSNFLLPYKVEFDTSKVNDWFTKDDLQLLIPDAEELTLDWDSAKCMCNETVTEDKTPDKPYVKEGGVVTIAKDGLRVVDDKGNTRLAIDGNGKISDPERIRAIIKRLVSVYIAKNDDYGDSVGKGRHIFGEVAELSRMSDKIHRFESLIGKEQSAKVNESLDDTVLDFVNYFAMYKSDLGSVTEIQDIASNIRKILSDPLDCLYELSRDKYMNNILNPYLIQQLTDAINNLK